MRMVMRWELDLGMESRAAWMVVKTEVPFGGASGETVMSGGGPGVSAAGDGVARALRNRVAPKMCGGSLGIDGLVLRAALLDRALVPSPFQAGFSADLWKWRERWRGAGLCRRRRSRNGRRCR